MHTLTAARPLATLVRPVKIPLLDGSVVEQVNFDHAASAPPLIAVTESIAAFLDSGQYAAIHRGLGYASQWCTELHEYARTVVRRFTNAPVNSRVIWTANTTGAINLLAHALGPDARVIAFAIEHHANLLPWQLCDLTLLSVPRRPAAMLTALETELAAQPTTLVTVTGASNVTGEMPPLTEICALAARYDARVLIDGAQWAAHYPVDLTALGEHVWLALSGHKLGAPLGVGALIGPALPGERDPLIRGGAVVDFVLPDLTVMWSTHPEHRYEPGSPNLVGVLATAVAMETLMSVGMSRIAMAEHVLLGVATTALACVPGLEIYRMWPGAPRIGVLTFNVPGIPYAVLAARLSAEYGIATRHGCFCAHPLVAYLSGIDLDQAKLIGAELRNGGGVPGAVRVSFGLDTTFDSIIRLTEALLNIVKQPPKWDYRLSPDRSDCVPYPDPRQNYQMPFDLARIRCFQVRQPPHTS